MVSGPQCEHVSCNKFSPRSKNSQSISITSRKKTAWHQLESNKYYFFNQLTDIISDIAVCLRVSDICSFGNYGMEAWPIAVWHPGQETLCFCIALSNCHPSHATTNLAQDLKEICNILREYNFEKRCLSVINLMGNSKVGLGAWIEHLLLNWISWLAHRSSSGSPSFWVPSIAGQCFKMFLWRHGHSAELLVGKVCKPAVWQQHLT